MIIWFIGKVSTTYPLLELFTMISYDLRMHYDRQRGTIYFFTWISQHLSKSAVDILNVKIPIFVCSKKTAAILIEHNVWVIEIALWGRFLEVKGLLIGYTLVIRSCKEVKFFLLDLFILNKHGIVHVDESPGLIDLEEFGYCLPKTVDLLDGLHFSLQSFPEFCHFYFL